MRLLGVTICGIKRFREPVHLKVSGKLTALVGPNEAGKTTLLKAVELIDRQREFPLSLRARGYEGEVFVEARFGFAPDERDTLGLTGGHTACVRRNIGESEHRWTILPAPVPDLALRAAMRDRVNRLVGDLSQQVADGSARFDLGSAQRAAEHLGSYELFDSPQTDSIEQFLAQLSEPSLNDNGIAADLRHHLDTSSERLIYEQLSAMCPNFLYFGPRESELQDEYGLQELARPQNQPCLANLAHLVGLDLGGLYASAERGDPAATVRPMASANDKLRLAFEDVWTQHKVAVELTGDFRARDRQLQVFIGEPDGEFYKPSDRSAGLRWFVALYAFLRGAHGPLDKPPVLLVDEADIHLHYDAQADLVREMMRQRLTAEVIYTTHSAGCLPPDLSSVRVVEPVDDRSSTLVNKFWAHSDAKVSSLLMRMGASSFAFTRSRSAIATEGPSDFLLLPTLFRSIDDGWDDRSIQIVPVLASIAPGQVAELDREAGRVVYLTDCDEAGVRIRDMLAEQLIPAERLFGLPAPVVEVEDFVSKAALVEACAHLAEAVGHAGSPGPGDIPEVRRGRAIQDIIATWPMSPTKVDLAEFLRDIDGSILDEDRDQPLRDLHVALLGALA